MTPLNPRLCFSTLGCPEATLAEAAALAARFGIGQLELRCLRSQTLEPERFDDLLGDPREARALLDHHGLQTRALGTSVRLLAPEANALATLESFARLADTLDARWLRVFDGGTTGLAPTPDEWAAATELVEAWQATRQREGFRCELMVETHWALTSPAVAAEFMHRLPAVPLLWDTHHTWKAGFTLAEFWETARERIVHLHVKDSRPDPAAKDGWSYVLPGQGVFPWNELRDLITRDRFEGCISLEWERHWHPTLPPLEDALQAFNETPIIR